MRQLQGLKHLWDAGSQQEWENARNHYCVIPSVRKNCELERRLSCNKYVVDSIEEDLFAFLLNEYCAWKYTDCRWKTTAIKNLKGMSDEKRAIAKLKILSYIHKIKDLTCERKILNDTIIKEGIALNSYLDGIGIAGISGLLALSFPNYFGVIDQFVLEAFSELNLSDKKRIEAVTVKDAIAIEKELHEKAIAINDKFNTQEWTPRMVEMALWAFGR